MKAIMRVARMTGLVTGMTTVAILAQAGPAQAAPASTPGRQPAATVCIPFLTGTGCVVFQEARPNRPGTSPGMRVTLTPTELTPTGELVMQIRGFQPGEGLQRWNYNIFGQGRMNEYTGEYRQADRRGRFRWVVAPSTAIYEPSWGKPALCVRGIKSQRLACAQFTVADGSGEQDQNPSAPAPSAPAPGTNPASPSPTPAPTSTLPPNCKDYGFTVMCTG
jgi:hypothetical protein